MRDDIWKGQGVAQPLQNSAVDREEVAKGMSTAAKEMEMANLDTSSMIMFNMWTDAIKQFAEVSKGNVIFLDGSTEGMQSTLKQWMFNSQVYCSQGFISG